MDDNQIVQLFWERNEQAITETDKKHGKRCRIIAENILNNREDASDCVNDSYFKLWNLIPPERPSFFGAFLSSVVKHTAIDFLKAKTAVKRGGGEMPLVIEELEDVVSDNSNVERNFENKEIIGKINDFLESLPLKNRRMFVLRYWYCCEIPEIASRLGMRKNTVSVTLNRIRKQLREYLKKGATSYEFQRAFYADR